MSETKNIDLLNIGLIIISLIIAVKLPFKLFLFSYAVLGPLHYLTEIVWLRDRNYFMKSTKNWVYVLILFSILITVYPVLKFIDPSLLELLKNEVLHIGALSNILLLVGFLFSIGLIFFKKTKDLLILLLSALFISFIANRFIPQYFIFIGLFVPTLIHVYLFTLLFIIYGAIKAKSRQGLYLAIVLALVPVILIIIPVDYTHYKPSQDTMNTFVSSNMIYVSSTIATLLSDLQGGKFYALSEIGLKIQIFIAFAYTYHYLNWFSKTTAIGWKKAISKKRAIIILVIWAISTGLYFYDFKTGFVALFLLSFLHVFLEFPLNAITIKELFMLSKNKT